MSDRYAKENYLHTDWDLKRRQGHIYNTLLSEHADILKGENLMLGCNMGSTLQLIESLGHRVIGMDTNAEAIDSGAQEVSSVVGDALDMDFRASHFDTIIAFDFIEHIYPSDMPKLIAECMRVLKPKGKVFAFSPRTDPKHPSQSSMDVCHVQFFTNMSEFDYQWRSMFLQVDAWHESRSNPDGSGTPHDAFAMILESRKCESRFW